MSQLWLLTVVLLLGQEHTPCSATWIGGYLRTNGRHNAVNTHEYGDTGSQDYNDYEHYFTNDENDLKPVGHDFDYSNEIDKSNIYLDNNEHNLNHASYIKNNNNLYGFDRKFTGFRGIKDKLNDVDRPNSADNNWNYNVQPDNTHDLNIIGQNINNFDNIANNGHYFDEYYDHEYQPNSMHDRNANYFTGFDENINQYDSENNNDINSVNDIHEKAIGNNTHCRHSEHNSEEEIMEDILLHSSDIPLLLQDYVDTLFANDVNVDNFIKEMVDLDVLLNIAKEVYNLNLNSILNKDLDEYVINDHNNKHLNGENIPIINRRKRSPEPRRVGGRRSSSSSRSRWGSRRTTSTRVSTSRWGSTTSRVGSTSSTSRGSSNTGRVVAGTAVGGGALAGAGVVATSSRGTGLTSSSPYPTSGGASYPRQPTAGSPYPTSGGAATAGAPYPTSGGTTRAGVPYPTSGGAATAGAPYPTSGGAATAGSPYPTSGGAATARAPYPTSGGAATAGAPYPTSGGAATAGAPYPTAAGRPTAGAPYPTAGAAPYPTSGVRPTAGAPYPTGGSTYPGTGRYPTGGSQPYPASGGGNYQNVGGYNNRGQGGYSAPGTQNYGNYGNYPPKAKSSLMKTVVQAAIAGYAIHTISRGIGGLFSPSVFSSRPSHYDRGNVQGQGNDGYGQGFGHGYGENQSNDLTGADAEGGARAAKTILGAEIKIQIAKYAIKYGIGAAQIYFRPRLGYDLREEAIEKFIRRYETRTARQHRRYLHRMGINTTDSSWPGNITAGEDCARECIENDERACMFTFKVHLYQTLTRACYDCPANITDCLRPECITGAGTRRLLSVVNRQLPGPAIEVCRGDRILVEVYNGLPSSGVTFHWHGLTMDDDPYMDGVTGLMQCPIRPRDTFIYSFKAGFPGTHFWHAQEGLLRGEGLYGPLIVRKPKEWETHRLLYDHDLTAHVITISDLPTPTSEAQFVERFLNEDVTPPTSILINGRAGQKIGSAATLPYARIDVVKDQRFRLRFINAASLNCPVTVVAPSGHNFTVISADGATIAPFVTESLMIHNGERWDVVLTADQNPSMYWLTVLGEVECKGQYQYAVVSYKDSVVDPLMPSNKTTSNTTTNVTLTNEQIFDYLEDVALPSAPTISRDSSALTANTMDEDCSSPSVMCLSEMRSTLYAPLPAYVAAPWVQETLFIAFGAQPLHNSHFYSLLYYGPQFMPLKKRSKTPQVNNLSLKLPAKPLLFDQSPLKGGVCTSEGVRRKHCVGDYCECIHNYELPVGEIVELIILNEGHKGETVAQPVHLHGYRFWVLGQEVYKKETNDTVIATTTIASDSTTTDNTNNSSPTLPQPSDEAGFTRLHVLNLFTNDKLKRNFDHPIMKDTISIPSGGYAIIRFRAENKGFWLVESQVLLQSVAGQAFVLQVGNSTELPRAPRGFPKC